MKLDNTKFDSINKMLSYSNGKNGKLASSTTPTSTPITNTSVNIVEKPYLRCEKNENTCENEGICYKKNRRYFKYYNNDYEEISKIKICM